MKTSILKNLVLVIALLGGASALAGNSQNIRATQLDQKIWRDLNQGKVTELTVEFRQGDRLPVVFQTEGDFLETSEANPSYVVVKRPFWMKLTQAQVQMSLDGTSFQPIQNVVKGTFTAGASSDQPAGGGIANAIQLLLKAELK